ncbi:hypothetical protein J2W32_006455 [Variovorax boronicumulans]|uniref:Uncharacterized protein n=1 Tax=Variovorax boronicumulans TaxID=436515 RepID=A0AAW8D173_9BURK|nr:hypothetical protein [Variovorax boronicumulans]MDP9897388.1 hypothetical protein [Variovorax boronicumulans]MDQ0057378.1 hypothetical protein [Variovorax boronicumulans]
MIFIFSFWFLLFGFIVACSPGHPRRQRIASIALAFLLCVVFLQALGILGPQAIAANATNYTPGLIFILGMVSFGFFAAVLVYQRTSQELTHARAGTAVFAALAGIYLMFTAVDHWWFIRGDEEKTGWASPSAMGVKEVDCDFALVRVEDEVITYRCAHLFVFGKLYAHPFVPWPSYSSGTSAEMKAKHDELMRQP